METKLLHADGRDKPNASGLKKRRTSLTFRHRASSI